MKTITVKDEVWEKLHRMKMDTRAKSVSVLIADILKKK